MQGQPQGGERGRDHLDGLRGAFGQRDLVLDGALAGLFAAAHLLAQQPPGQLLRAAAANSATGPASRSGRTPSEGSAVISPRRERMVIKSAAAMISAAGASW